MSVQVGSVAPDFTLPDSNRSPVTLSDFRGKKAVLVVFYPFAFSNICTTELCALRDDLDSFQNEQVQVLAVSTDPAPTLQAWAAAQGYEFPLLSDFWPHGEVARAYGVLNEDIGLAVRGTFIIDKAGRVAYKVVNGIPDARDQEEYKRVLASLT